MNTNYYNNQQTQTVMRQMGAQQTMPQQTMPSYILGTQQAYQPCQPQQTMPPQNSYSHTPQPRGGYSHILYTDLETYSDRDLKECGVYRYSESPQFRILLCAYAFDDDPVRVADLASTERPPAEKQNTLPNILPALITEENGDETFFSVDVLPDVYLDALFDPNILKVAHNAQFERVCLSKYLQRIGRLNPNQYLEPEQWECTMAHSAMLGFPFSLDAVAQVLKTGEQKDKAGVDLIKYFSMPCKPTLANKDRTRNMPIHAPEKWKAYRSYCLQDVATERAIHRRLSVIPIPPMEKRIYSLDQRINDRGVLLDMGLTTQAVQCDYINSEHLTKRASELTGLKNPNSISQLKTWLEARGLRMNTIGRDDVEAQIKDLLRQVETNMGADKNVLEVLNLRLQLSKSSVKKYQAAERAVCADGRARGLFRYYGASHTGRFTSKIIQLQNLPQNHISTLDEARQLLKLGAFDMLEVFYDSPTDVLSQLLRTMLIPASGREFVVADFSAIEARVLAWVAGEEWRLKAFRNGADIYCASASQMFGVPVVKHGINGHLRQKGKISELACVAAGNLVVTENGLIPIEAITTEHKLWDGENWVYHDGLLYKGEKECFTFGGLTATPDHLVWCPEQHRFIPFLEYIRVSPSCEEYDYVGFKSVYDIKNAGPKHCYFVSNHLVHNCGYGGGTGALVAMGALDMGLKEAELPDLITNWRKSNPAIVQFWYDVEKSVAKTVKTGITTRVGRITFWKYTGELFITLPSGRKLAYVDPQIVSNRFNRESIGFMGLGMGNKWVRMETYGGKLVENIIQGIARDLLAEAMLRVESAGYPIILHCHDEMVVEVPKNALSVDTLCKIMSVNPPWADGLPLNADGYACQYYRKD